MVLTEARVNRTMVTFTIMPFLPLELHFDALDATWLTTRLTVWTRAGFTLEHTQRQSGSCLTLPALVHFFVPSALGNPLMADVFVLFK